MPKPAQMSVGIAALVVGVMVVGCADPDSAVGFDEPAPSARFRAIRAAAETRDRSAIPDLIRLLNSDDPAERVLAIGALERITGQTLGYDASSPREDRAEAVERWRAWYADQGRNGSWESARMARTSRECET